MYKNRAGLVTIVEPRGNDKATWKNAKQKVDAQFQQRLWQQGNTKQWSRDLRLFFLLDLNQSWTLITRIQYRNRICSFMTL